MRQETEETAGGVTGPCLAVLLVLTILLLAGVALLAAGLATLTSCSHSYLPTWLVLQV